MLRRIHSLLVFALLGSSLLLSQGGAFDLCRCAGFVDALRVAAGAPCCCEFAAVDAVDGAADEVPVLAPVDCPGCGSVVFEAIELGFEGSTPVGCGIPPAPRFVVLVLAEPGAAASVRPRAPERGPPSGPSLSPGLLPGTRPLRI